MLEIMKKMLFKMKKHDYTVQCLLSFLTSKEVRVNRTGATTSRSCSVETLTFRN